MGKLNDSNDLMNEIEKAMTNPVGYMNDNVESMFREAEEVRKDRKDTNLHVAEYIEFFKLELARKHKQCEREFQDSPILKTLKNVESDIDACFNMEFGLFNTSHDLVAYLREMGLWADISLSNKMALRMISKDENKLERFIEKQKEKALGL